MSRLKLWRLERQLDQGDDEASEQAVRALAEIDSDRSVDLLIDEVKLQRRLSAACALGSIGSARAVEFLVSFVQELLATDADRRYVRDLLVLALPLAGDERATRLLVDLYRNHELATVREDAIHGLMVQALIESPNRYQFPPHTRRQAFADIAETLTSALSDEDSAIRSDVAQVIYKLEDPRTVEPLIALLDDEDHGVRLWAAKSLARMGDTRAIEPLIAIVCSEELGSRPRQISEVAVDALVALCRVDRTALIAAARDQKRADLLRVLDRAREHGVDDPLPPDIEELIQERLHQ